MRRSVSVVLLAMTIAAGGCYLIPVSPPPPRPMRSPHPVDWRTLVGCWRMMSASSRPELVAFDSVLAPEPRSVPGGPARLARTIPHVDDRSTADTWRITARNTVEYVDHSGWGSTWEFVVRGDSLAGRMYVHPDLPWEPPRIRAAAVRAPCP